MGFSPANVDNLSSSVPVGGTSSPSECWHAARRLRRGVKGLNGLDTIIIVALSLLKLECFALRNHLPCGVHSCMKSAMHCLNENP